MRFAGSAPVTDFLAKSMDHGATAQAAAKTRSAVNQAGVEAQGQTAARGISAAGEVEAASIVGAAQSSLANAQGQVAMMKGIGSIAGSAIGAFGGGGSISSYSDIPSAGLTGSAAGAGADLMRTSALAVNTVPLFSTLIKMARFAGSRAPQIRIGDGLGRSGQNFGIKPISFDPGSSSADPLRMQ